MKWGREVTITTNENCNLNCVYCYENKTSNKTFNVSTAKTKLEKILRKPQEEGITISFHGGEPFLVFEKIKELCEWIWDQDFPNSYRCFATTNGTLVHGEIQQWLFEHRRQFICSLSLDGNRDMHNTNRSNSFDLIDIPFFINTWPEQGIKMTISPKTILNLSEGIIFLHEIGIPEVRANLSEMTNWDDDDLLLNYQRELEKLSDYYLNNPQVKPCSLFNVPFFTITETTPPQKWCGVGDTPTYDIDTDVVFPCHLFFASVCGEVKSKESRTFDFSNPNLYISKDCANCVFLRICPTCYGANFIERGHPALRDMVVCKYQKVRFVIVAEYEYKRIKAILENGNCSIDKPTSIRFYRILEGIKRVIPQLNNIAST